jgi:glutaredoxin
MKKVSIITRSGCHLCEIAVDKVKSVKDELNFELEIKLVDGSTELEELYGEQVPVVIINEKIHDYWRVDLARFRTAIKS